jgi:hypothetical protein
MKLYFYLHKTMNAACQFDLSQAVANLKNAILCAQTEEDLFWNFNYSIHTAIGVVASIMNQIPLAIKQFDHVIQHSKNDQTVAYAMIFKMGAQLSQLNTSNQDSLSKQLFKDLDSLKLKSELMKIEGVSAAESLIRSILCSLSENATQDAEKYITQATNVLSLENKQFAARASILLGKLFMSQNETFEKIKKSLGNGITMGTAVNDLFVLLYGKKLYLRKYSSLYL